MVGPERPVTQLRCPVCLARDVDVVLRTHPDDFFACVKCSYTGDEADIRQRYADARTKFRWRARRMSREDLDQL